VLRCLANLDAELTAELDATLSWGIDFRFGDVLASQAKQIANPVQPRCRLSVVTA
jgi:hypothetical protein